VAEDMSAVRYRVPAFSLAVAGAAAVRCPFGSVVRERRADPAAVVEDLSGSPAVRARSGVHALIRRWVGVPGGCRRDRDWVPEHRTAARRYRADISPQGGPRTESAIRAHHRPPASAAGDRRRRAHMCRTECRRRGLLDPPRTASMCASRRSPYTTGVGTQPSTTAASGSTSSAVRTLLVASDRSTASATSAHRRPPVPPFPPDAGAPPLGVRRRPRGGGSASPESRGRSRVPARCAPDVPTATRTRPG
jgi:hypothetical protein